VSLGSEKEMFSLIKVKKLRRIFPVDNSLFYQPRNWFKVKFETMGLHF
jgi:hypothetical protein